jgi:hypothetical protein
LWLDSNASDPLIRTDLLEPEWGQRQALVTLTILAACNAVHRFRGCPFRRDG